MNYNYNKYVKLYNLFTTEETTLAIRQTPKRTTIFTQANSWAKHHSALLILVPTRASC